jgi:hypothetical protein
MRRTKKHFGNVSGATFRYWLIAGEEVLDGRSLCENCANESKAVSAPISMTSVVADAFRIWTNLLGTNMEPKEPPHMALQATRREGRDDLARARQYGDSLRTFIAASNTGAIGILLATAGSLAGNEVIPKWVTVPVIIFAFNLLLFGASLLMGEHRSLLRRSQKGAQSQLPVWKVGLTWDIVILIFFVVGVIASVVALRGVTLPRSSGCGMLP